MISTGTPGIHKIPVDLRSSGAAQSYVVLIVSSEGYVLYCTGVGADHKQHRGQRIGLCLCIFYSASPGGSVILTTGSPLLPSNLFAFLAARFVKYFRQTPGM